MSDLELRPRFRFQLDLSREEAASKIEAALNKIDANQFVATRVHGHYILRIHPDKKHFWSPQLDISMQELDEGGTLIRCLIAPEPAIWTMFMFIYSASGFAAFIGLMLGLSQWSLERNMWGFYLFLGSLLFGLVFYFVAQGGKKLAHDEMVALKAIIDPVSK